MSPKNFKIEPPPKEKDIYRVVYIIDVNAADPNEAAKLTHEIMTDPDSLLPVLHVIDTAGGNVKIDLSMEGKPR